MISLIAAMDRNQNIGFKGDMPWGMDMKDDLKRFKELTDGKTIIMGRKTFESLPGILPNRHHIVISNQNFKVRSPLVDVIADVERLIRIIKSSETEYIVIGGGQIYQEFIPYADKIYLTKVGGYFEGDTKFPSILGKWNITECEKHEADDNNPYPYTFMTYERG